MILEFLIVSVNALFMEKISDRSQCEKKQFIVLYCMYFTPDGNKYIKIMRINYTTNIHNYIFFLNSETNLLSASLSICCDNIYAIIYS